MRVNHKATQTELKELINETNSLLIKAKSYDAKKENIKNDIYASAEGKAVQINAIDKVFGKEALNFYDIAELKLSNILQLEKEAATQFDVNDADFQNRINLINTLNGKISEEIRIKIIEPSIGNNQEMLMLKTLFERYGLHTMDIDKHIIDIKIAERKVEQVSNFLWFVVRNLGDVTAKLPEAIKSIYELADMLHIEIPEDKDTKDEETEREDK